MACKQGRLQDDRGSAGEFARHRGVPPCERDEGAVGDQDAASELPGSVHGGERSRGGGVERDASKILDAGDRDLDVVDPEAFHHELKERRAWLTGFDQRESGVRPDDRERDTRKACAGTEVRDRLGSADRGGGSKRVEHVAFQEAFSIPGSDESPRDGHVFEEVDVGPEPVRSCRGAARRGTLELAYGEDQPPTCFT
ncbi:MAG TPA: hypothetical protein VEC15_04415 [Actinomycetota bacterium]|nr:hypothetical protein [Actinomycetota bacterium]